MSKITLILTSLIISFHAFNLQAQGEGKSSPKEFVDGAYCNVLYWPNKNMGFGHVSLEVFSSSSKKVNPDTYLSWAMGNNYYTDFNKHQIEPLRVTLPIRSQENYRNFRKWLDQSEYEEQWSDSDAYGKTYSMVKNNCAHAVVLALKAFGYDIKLGKSWGLRPAQVKKEAQKIRDNEK